MSFTFLDFLYLIGSLGLFLYGMKIMSESLQKVAGDKMKSILAAMTSNPFLGVITGLGVTALVQSSSATTVMVVSFVNAGLLSLEQSISVIMGANIGTTVTAWIISLLGFKVDISVFAIPLLALAIPLIFSKKASRQSWGEFIIGFSLLFLGLQFLKDSMPDLQSNPAALAFLGKYTGMGYGSVLLFLLIGTVMTLIVQSSSAMVAITFIMCSQGWIPFEIGIAMILGENLGTTITANVAALSANTTARRAAFSHFLFNFFGVIWVMALFYPATKLISSMTIALEGLDPREIFTYIGELNETFTANEVKLITTGASVLDPAMIEAQKNCIAYASATSIGLTLFHTFFNLINTLIMVWFIPGYAKISEAVIKTPKKKKTEKEFSHLQYLNMRNLSTSELSMLQVNKEVVNFARKTREMLNMVRVMSTTDDDNIFESNYFRIDKYERICDRVEVEIVRYLSEVSAGDLSSESRRNVSKYQRISSEIESIGDACYNLAQILKRKKDDGVTSPAILQERVENLHILAEEILDHTIRILEIDGPDRDMMIIAQDLEEKMNTTYNSYIKQNLEALANNSYPYVESVYYLDQIDEYELLADYAINIAEEMNP